MALEIIWSSRAEKGFDKIVRHLEENWSEREIKYFMQEAQEFFEILKKYPKMLQPSIKSNLYRGPMNRLTIVTYRINPKKRQIVLINIRSARQKPLK